MAHKNNKIYDEAMQKLISMQSFGQSKHLDKQNKCTQDKIYSFSTYKAYKEKIMEFITYAKKEHKCTTLEDSKKYINEFLKMKIDKGYSPWTIRLYAAALAKLFQVSSSSFIELPRRTRNIITRSRKDVSRDKHFSKSKNSTLISFCKSCGLRRSELQSLRREDCYFKNGEWYIYVRKGKGGKSRNVLCNNLSQECINKILNTPKGNLVWGKIHSACDVHYYRSVYCNDIYNRFSRPLDSLKRNEKYYARRDLKGEIYDVNALKICSHYLGHERWNIVVYSYMRKKDQ